MSGMLCNIILSGASLTERFNRISLDGEWPKDSGVQVGTANLSSGSDDGKLEFEFHYAWDMDNLYVFANIKDSTPLQNPNTGADIWNGDAIELFFGPTDTDTGGPLKAKDRQIILRGAIVDGKFEGHWYNTDTQAPIDLSDNRVRMRKGTLLKRRFRGAE